jgi:hypothetical protein
MTAFANDRQEMGRIAALEAELDAAEMRAEEWKTQAMTWESNWRIAERGWQTAVARAEAAERALASLPDSAAKLRAVVDAAEEETEAERRAMCVAPRSNADEYQQELQEAGDARRKAVAALQASRKAATNATE